MGHSVQTLVSTYVGALHGDEEAANERIAAALGAAQPGTLIALGRARTRHQGVL